MIVLRTFALAFGLGGLAACGFAPLNLWPLTLACLAAFTALVEQAGVRRAGAIGWWFGLGYFCVGLNWIATAFTYQAAMPAWLGWVAVVLLSLYLAVFPAATALVARLVSVRLRVPAAPLLAAGWILSEWLRATLFTGFAWNPLAAIWIPVLPVAWITTLVGTYGLSGLTMLLAGGLLAGWRRTGDRTGGRIALLIGASLLAIVVTVAASRLPTPDGTGPLLRIVQPNVGQESKWNEESELRNYARLVRLTGRPGPVPRLLLWPEVAVPWFIEEDALARDTIARVLGPHDLLLTGAQAVQYGPNGDPVSATNSLFGMTPDARLVGRYDKSHLVPYGEYLPMRPLLSRLGLSRLAPGDMDFRPGPGPRDIILPGIGPVGVQICYEIIFSGHVVDRAHRPLFLFNPSNDAWFGRWGPPQHLAQARLRAIEEGLPVVRATPTGISAVVDARGRLLESLPWRTAGAIERRLPPALAPTLFARFGNVLPLLLAAALAVAGIARRRRAG